MNDKENKTISQSNNNVNLKNINISYNNNILTSTLNKSEIKNDTNNSPHRVVFHNIANLPNKYVENNIKLNMDEMTQGIDSNNLSDDSFNNDEKTITNSESTITNTYNSDDKQNSLNSLNSVNVVGKTKRPRKARSIFSVEQLKILNDEFERHNYINNYTREELAMRASITPEQVKIWFQNMRSKKRKYNEKSRQNYTGMEFVPNPLQLQTMYHDMSNNIPQSCISNTHHSHMAHIPHMTHTSNSIHTQQTSHMFNHPNYYVNNDYPIINHNINNYQKINRPTNTFNWDNNYQTPPFKIDKNNVQISTMNIPYNCNQDNKDDKIKNNTQKTSSKTPQNYVAPGFASTLYNAKLQNIKKNDSNCTVQNTSNSNTKCFKPNLDNSCNIQQNQVKKGFSSSTPQRTNSFQNNYNNSHSGYSQKSKTSVPVPISNYSQAIQSNNINNIQPNH